MPSALEVIYRCCDFVAINKPAGLAVQRNQDEMGLTTLLCQQLQVERVWLVHRLDKATSGVLLLAFNQASATELSQAFAEHRIKKTYWALSDGKPHKKQGWIKGDMSKSRRGAWKLLRSQENPAITYFTSRSIAPKLRLFELQPQTGKTHQLRVALKSLACPILGDELYGGTQAERMFLHAKSLQFDFRGEQIELIAPLDEYWQRKISVIVAQMP